MQLFTELNKNNCQILKLEISSTRNWILLIINFQNKIFMWKMQILKF